MLEDTCGPRGSGLEPLFYMLGLSEQLRITVGFYGWDSPIILKQFFPNLNLMAEYQPLVNFELKKNDVTQIGGTGLELVIVKDRLIGLESESESFFQSESGL